MVTVIRVSTDLSDVEGGHVVTVELRLFGILIKRKQETFLHALVG